MIWANMQFSTMKDKDANEYYARMLTYIVYLATLFALPIAILVEDLLRIFSPLRYWEAAMVVPWLAVAAVLDAANPVLNVGINLKRKSLINPIIVISSALFNIGLNFLLIPDFGMMGATIATVLSYVFICAVKYFISHHFYPIQYQWKRILQIIIVGIALFMLSQTINIDRPILSFAARLPLTIMLPFILIPLGFYDAQEWAKIMELIKRIKAFFTAIIITKSSDVGN
jgi:O-antigen/teichoic acid export membrane protein